MSSRNVYIAAGVACMTGSIFGYSVGYIGGVLVLPSFLHHFRLDSLSEHDLAFARSAIVSFWLVGALVGVPTGLSVCSRFGRKPCLAFSAMLYLLGAVLQLVPWGESMSVFALGRLLNGIGVGVGTLVSPVFISEISSPNQRGMLMSGYQVAIQICALVGFWGAFASNSAFPDSSNLQWQIPIALQLIPGAILFCGSLYIPESPLWLAERNEMASVRKSLAWFRMEEESSSNIASEAEDLHTTFITSKNAQALRPDSSFLREAFSKRYRKRLGVGIGLMTLQTISGANALNFYAPSIFMSAGFTSVSASLFLTGLFGAVKLIAALAFMVYFIRVKGNRFWLLLGSALCALSMFVLAYCVKTLSAPASKPEGGGLALGGVVASLMVFIFAFAFGVGIGPISWNVCSEIFPTHMNTKCCTITTCVQWIFQIVSAVATPHLIAGAGWVTYVVFGGICAFSFFWCGFYVPETRGVALGRAMDAVFEGKSDDDNYVAVEEVEDISEETPLLSARQRRRSSINIYV